MNIAYFPVINATLNGASAVFLVIAYGLIKARRFAAHATMMIAALVTSTAFLTCYLIYHALRVRQGITVTHFPQARSAHITCSCSAPTRSLPSSSSH